MARLILHALFFAIASIALSEAPATSGVPVAYQLPIDGPLPRTYRVTLAIVDSKNPDWIVSPGA